ncbi:MAG: SDR family oxidoreductase [Deltaproteobacteria bacterium]|nr:SDR family oxidoreductase [Deltaproteobacteria bacterium]
MRLANKIALITGAARGTGEQTARLFAAEGARVVIGDVLEAEGRAVAQSLGAAAHFVKLDVTSEASWAGAVEETRARFGGLNVLVNNAGLLHRAPLEETSVDTYERLFRVNQLGPFLGIKAVTPALKAAGGGSIVNISSIDGLMAHNNLVAYASTKWALRGITRVAALELGVHGIRVNAVCPEVGGPAMRAPYVPAGIDPEKILAIAHEIIPYNRKREPVELIRDVARMVLFLASDESLSCTGADYAVDAGGSAGVRTKY